MSAARRFEPEACAACPKMPDKFQSICVVTHQYQLSRVEMAFKLFVQVSLDESS